MEVKQRVRALLDRLPDDCTLDDVLYHVYVLDQISRGLRDVDAGRTIPQEQVRERLPQTRADVMAEVSAMRSPFLEVTFRKGKPIAAYLYLPRQSGAKVVRTVEIRPQIQVDYAAGGEPIGVELTSPTTVDVATINAVLGELGAPSLEAEDLRPLQAA